MTEEELFLKYIKENSDLIKKYKFKGDLETYRKKSEELKKKYIGTPIEKYVLEDDMDEYMMEEEDDEEEELLPYEEILALEDSEDFVLQFDLFLEKKCDYGNQIELLNPIEKVFYYVNTLNEEVHSSGFDGYLSSSCFPGAVEIERSLREIKAEKVLKIWKKVEKKFPKHCIPNDMEERIDVIEKKRLSFEKLDDKFYDYPDDLEELLFEYVQKNRSLGEV